MKPGANDELCFGTLREINMFVNCSRWSSSRLSLPQGRVKKTLNINLQSILPDTFKKYMFLMLIFNSFHIYFVHVLVSGHTGANVFSRVGAI